MLNDHVGAAAGFVSLVNLVQSAPDDGLLETNEREECKELLADSRVRQYLDDWYGLTQATRKSTVGVQLKALELHRVGTTSFLLRCGSSQGDLGWKCLKPRYSAIRTIALATRNYQSEMASLLRPLGVHTPHVYDFESERFIAMEFIEGDTLDEDSRLRSRGLDDPEDFSKIIESLCVALSALAANRRAHLDLSAHNVIIETKTRTPYLIDFGRNFLVDELLRGGAAYDRIAAYVAPELLRDASSQSYLCDFYSLGMIILDGATGGRLTRVDASQRLMQLWHQAPGIARIAERLASHDPRRRISFLEADVSDPETAYKAMRVQIAREIEVARVIAKAPSGEGGLRPLPLWQYPVAGFSHVRALFATAQELKKSAERAAHTPGTPAKSIEESLSREEINYDAERFWRLGVWSAVYLAVWIAVFWPAVYLTVGDINAHFPTWLAGIFGRDAAPPKHPAFLHNLPGRAIATTTALLAIAYYINIFSTLDLRKFSKSASSFARTPWFTTRILPLIALGGQSYAVYHDPRAWGYTAGIGGLLVSLNNLEWSILVEAAKKESRDDALTRELESFQDSFRMWWRLMGLYSLAVLVVGLLVRYGVAHDELIYAVVIAGGVNLLKLYSGNATRQAARTRAQLGRAASILRDAGRPEIHPNSPAWHLGVVGSVGQSLVRHTVGAAAHESVTK
ncbi:MAG: RIO1 family regulatory kinase/ATPase [Gaiellaceae bacterium]